MRFEIDGSGGTAAENDAMKVLVATDAWRPQVNGVVRTLGALARAAAKLGVEIEFLSPEGFWTFPVPTYPGLRLALAGPQTHRRAHRARANPTPFMSRPKVRSATRCGATA